MRHIFYIFCLVVFSIDLSGQAVSDILQGKVSFVSSQNVYVKFQDTEGISAGDTLYISNKGKMIPALIVNNLSSVSCVCTAVSASNFSVSQSIVARKRGSDSKTAEEKIENTVNEKAVQQIAVDSDKTQSRPKELKQIIKGSISAYSYSDFSNNSGANSNRFRYTFSLDARNIGNSKFSTETYISFRHKLGDWGVVKENVFNALKIYNLAVRFDPSKTTQISVGRKINPRIASIGAIDGLQVEQSIRNFALGAIVGLRPDYTNYGFDSKLIQYGGYLAFSSNSSDTYSESSLAFMQQMNNSKIDRRFLYFQHSNSLIKNLYLYSTFEIDLYQLKDDKPRNTLDLTGLYFSIRYKMTKNFSITGSYDSRKNTLYYETYKTLIDSVLINEIRQSYRLQLNYRITKDLMFGLQSGYRFLKSDPHPSRNVYSYLTYSQVPGLNISVTLNGTYLESNYLNGKILGVTISRDLFHGKLQTNLGFRYVDYRLPENLLNIVQNVGEMGVYWLFPKKISISVNYEGTFEQKDEYHRIFVQVRKRF